VGEFGSVVLISGNLPFKTEVASVFVFGQIESDRATTGGGRSRCCCSVISFLLLLGFAALSARGTRHEQR
jgi:sulfate transport system permease protein